MRPSVPMLLLPLLACGDGADELPPGTESVRDTRYCEVIPIFLVEGGMRADVWNTLGFNDCPQAEWDALDPNRIAVEQGALVTKMNGPRAFLMDAMEDASEDGPPEVTTFGGLQMSLVAALDLPAGSAEVAPYTERAVERETVFTFWEGSEVYELVGPEGTYVMQAYAMIVDPDLGIDDLSGLGDRLEPPDGWEFRVRVLDQRLDVETNGQGAIVVQDELENTYQKYR